MSMSRVAFAALASALLFVSPAAAATVTLRPFLSGLSSPVLVTNAGDTSRRVFIVERAGVIKVLQPGATTPTVFLNIASRLVSGGEQGLLGLAFHPQYAANGRFFVYYTRTGDGALKIAEYAVSANPDVAATTETTILVVPHPGATNHNGGMLAFGTDGYLYAGTGDGGGGNDPSNNAQNLNVLLGKILRLDIDPPAGSGVPYLSPASNPFFGAIPGRDEIYAYGLRNPWRFSFDRATGAAWVGDVGQGAREEVDSPLVVGGNYGWRVYEGFGCTGLDPSLCVPANYVMPVFQYDHSGGRCSLTGGYVYRGSALTLPSGTYVYADYCSGEIFTWDGVTQSVLVDTAMNISSFGEDEDGELYVVDLNGTINQLTRLAPCAYSLSVHDQAMPDTGGTATVTVNTSPTCDWTANTDETWLHITAGASGRGTGVVTYTVDPNPSASPRMGLMAIADGGQQFLVTQDGLPGAACSYEVTPLRAGVGASGRLAVRAAPGCAWTAQSLSPDLTVVSGASGSGAGVVSYRVARTRGRGRRAPVSMVVAGRTITVGPAR